MTIGQHRARREDQMRRSSWSADHRTLKTDVLVVGGGTAGVTAAIAAAEEGAAVVLVESDSGLGGVGVRAGINSYYLGSKGGLQDTLDQTVLAVNAQMGSSSKGFIPESKGLAVARRMAELGICVIYNAVVSEVIMEGRSVCGAAVETEQDAFAIEAAVTVDSTANGDVAYLAGAAYTLGRDWDGALHNFSLVPTVVGKNNTVHGKNFDIGWVDVTDVADVSRAYRAGRRHVWRQGEDPTNTHFTVIGPQLGLREGRLVIGEYVLSQHDFLVDKRFDDAVMRCFAHHENHAYDYANESEWSQLWVAVFGMWRFGFGGELPYRCFVPLEIDGLLISCRALSQDHDSMMMLRMQRDLHKIGEVAGTAAARCVLEGVCPRKIDVKKLQERLLARGVLKAEETARPVSPWLTFKDGESGESMNRLLTDGPDRRDIEALIARLGGDEEPVALWWLWTLGDVCMPPLLEALPRTEGRQRRGVAFALGLLKHDAGADELADTFRRKDADKPNDQSRTEESWVSALILLKNMKHPAVAADVMERMKSERKSTTLLFMIHYLIAIAEQLDPSSRAEAIAAVESVLAYEQLGDDFVLHGSGTTIPATSDTRSMRWGLELACAYLLEAIGGQGLELLRRYRTDHRGYAKVAAAALTARLAELKGAAL